MNVVLADSDSQELFGHLLLYGAAAICGDAGLPDVTVSWTRGPAPRPTVGAQNLDEGLLGKFVHRHAAAHAHGSWLQADQPAAPGRGLLSPRVKPPADRAAWQALQAARHTVLDELTAVRAWSDLRLLAALGEPAYWRVGRDGSSRPDEGASRLEMQARNQGSEIVGTKLRPLADAVARRTPEQVAAGLVGVTPVDELSGDRADGRTATNLRRLGPADAAQAWVALWGLGLTPIAHQVHSASRTATHVPRASRGPRAGTFVAPVWHEPWRPARLRSVLRSKALSDAGLDLVEGRAVAATARAWLDRRGVLGLVAFPVDTGGSTSAPERRALGGELHRFGGI